ncbi:MAG TPA: sigma-70 family RNA polymerase sigma factor [Verrucomicrobiae bacterium]|nr:sigma-70 family RNA polymerase sigma factor [Verrucomicrobiae bacterium]
MAKKSLSTNEMSDSSNDFESVYEANRPLIYRFMFWRTQNEMLAEDLTSHVFEKAWRTRLSFKGGSSKAWLFRIAHTTLIDHWRTRKEVVVDSTALSEHVDDRMELGEALDQKMYANQLRTAMNKLPEEMCRVLEFRFMQGLSTRETAEKLGISEANVRVIQYRALRKLRGDLR